MDAFFPHDHDNRSSSALGSISTRVPLFVQVKNSIVEKIKNGTWHHDDQLPNEIEMAELFHVSQGTMRRALRELVQEGILVRKQGKGTYVSSYEGSFDLFYKRFVPIVADDPEKVWKTMTKLLSFEVIAPSRRTMLLMGIDNPAEQIIHIRRLHYGRLDLEHVDSVDAFDEIFLRRRFFPELTEEAFRGQKASLYHFYQSLCDVTIIHARDIQKATLLNPEQAKLANVTPPYPAIILQRQAFDINDNLVELRFLTTVTDRCHFEFQY
ncbi:MAG TPA: GntR family transcriptional regulator [Candidatus Aphodousia gallistercoris]|nr:GntR family transcriptional regulator [Candidatus Aphodousia gallistercoris]